MQSPQIKVKRIEIYKNINEEIKMLRALGLVDFEIKIDGRTYTNQEALNRRLRGYMPVLNLCNPEHKRRIS